MTEVYTAPTNGHEITKTETGGLHVSYPGMDSVSGHEPTVLKSGRVQSLREFFQDERDKELGRWRWPENPEYVVYLKEASEVEQEPGVRVVHETSGRSRDIGRGVVGACDATVSLFGKAAQAYFDAHPVKKPWHDAKPGDTWVITTTLHRGEFAVIATTEGELQSANGFCYSPPDTSILSGRRIWERI